MTRLVRRTARSARRRPLLALLCVLVLAGGGATAAVALGSSGLAAPSLSATPAANPTNSTSIKFSYATPTATGYMCQLDGSGYASCPTTGASYSSLAAGSHTFQVYATGSSQQSPVSSYTWTIDLTPPTVTGISRAGASPTSAGSVSWTVTFSEAVTGVAAGNFSLAPSGLAGTPKVTGVSGSGTTWTVTAGDGSGTPADGSAGTLQLNLSAPGGITDLAGNGLANTLNGTGAVYQVDQFTPAPALTTAPPDPNGTATSTFAWSEQEPGDTFLCSTENSKFATTVPSEGGSPQPCSSPLTYNVATSNNGVHQFAVEALDALGNVSAVVKYSWKVPKTALPLSIAGNAGTVYPGGPSSAFLTTITNPNTGPVTITSLTVTLGTMPSGCQASWFTLTQSNVSGGNPLVVPGNGSVTLPQGSVSAPSVSMSDTGDQSNCEGKTIPVSYDNTFPASFQVGTPSPFNVTVGPISGGALLPTSTSSSNKTVDTVHVTIANPSQGAQFVHQVTYSVTSGWKAVLAGHPDCTAADFSIDGKPVGSSDTVTVNADIPGGGQITPTFTIQLVENGSDQTACEGANVGLTVDVS